MSTLSPEEIKRAKHESWLQMCLEQFHRSRGEEWANGISHLVGVIFGIVGLTLMCVFSAQVGTAKDITSCAIFGSALILLYTFSMLYHVFTNFRAKRVFQLLDHCGIFLLIAGSYTPFVLMVLSGKLGWTIFGLQWGFAVVGILISCLCTPKWSDILTLPIYIIMGWMIVVALPQIKASLTPAGFATLVAGGITYTVGVVFYIMDKVPYMHFIWHLFVLGGSVCHWVCITFHVLPKG